MALSSILSMSQRTQVSSREVPGSVQVECRPDRESMKFSLETRTCLELTIIVRILTYRQHLEGMKDGRRK
ncbi:hypothetical protein ACEPAH_3382 [Sanghuangporus vaninii]